MSGAEHGSTLVHLLRRRAAQQGDATAYRFSPDGELRECTLTYAALEHRALAIAALLRRRTSAGGRVLLAVPAGLDFIAAFFGCLLARAVPVALPAPHPARLASFQARTAGVVADAEPDLGLTTAALAAAFAAESGGPALTWAAIDGELPDADATDELVPPAPDELAFLQYTSGSTAAPRGVMVSHANVMHNLDLIRRAFAPEPGDDTTSVCWLPPWHDMGLVGGILGPLHTGRTALLMPPVAFVQQPRRWLEAVARTRAAVSGGPTFAYDLCAKSLEPRQFEGLDLRHWRVAFCGAEPVRAATLEAFARLLAPCGFRRESLRPCYGLAEATLLVSMHVRGGPARVESVAADALERHRLHFAPRTTAGARDLVSCGTPLLQVVVVDTDSGLPAAPGVVGEIRVAGESVCGGYWRRGDETAATFRAQMADGSAGEWLRTGDLGVLHEGELFVTGRIKDLIILDGVNHYPHDVEASAIQALQSVHAADCAAFSIDVDGREALVLVAAIRRGADIAAVVRDVRHAVSRDHDVRVHDVVLVRPGAIPRTSSGKLRRHACRSAYLAHTLARWEPA